MDEKEVRLFLDERNPLLVDSWGLCDDALRLLIEEAGAQIKKWGIQEHQMFDWLAFITEEVGELSQAMSEYRYRDGDLEVIIKEATHLATLSLKVAWMTKLLLEVANE